MGRLTRAQIVSEGLLMAGNSSLTVRANLWLNAWLRSQYKAWTWPFLVRRFTGVSVGAGVQSFSIGAGSNGVTNEIQQLRDPLYAYKSDLTKRYTVRVSDIANRPSSQYPTLVNTTTDRGAPAVAYVEADTSLWGKWTVYLYPCPDETLLFAGDYIEQPADITSDSTKPIYPNDRTMMKAVECEALNYMDKKDAYVQALSILAAMTVDDRMKYGEVPGTNGVWGLDPNTFR